MQRPYTAAQSTAASPVSPASPVSSVPQAGWQTALGRLSPALRAAWFVCLLAATALAGAAPGVIDVR